MVMEGGPVDREGARKKKFKVFHLRPKGEARQVCLVVEAFLFTWLTPLFTR